MNSNDFNALGSFSVVTSCGYIAENCLLIHSKFQLCKVVPNRAAHLNTSYSHNTKWVKLLKNFEEKTFTQQRLLLTITYYSFKKI